MFVITIQETALERGNYKVDQASKLQTMKCPIKIQCNNMFYNQVCVCTAVVTDRSSNLSSTTMITIVVLVVLGVLVVLALVAVCYR